MTAPTRDTGTVWVGRLAVLLFGLAFTWAAGGSVRLLTSTPYLGVASAAGGHPDPTVGQIDVSLASANGVWVVGLLCLVTVLFALPFGVALTYPTGQRLVGWTIGCLVLAFSIIGGFSVGLTYLPAALLVVAGAALSPVRGSPRPHPGLTPSDS